MKYFIMLMLPFYLFASPSWFHNIKHKDYEIVAYGVDKNLQIAKDLANAELSKTIKIKITSDSKIDKSIVNGNYNKSIQSKLSTTSNATLEGVRILKEVKKDNLWYVCVIYDNRTLLQKINIKYQNYKESNLKELKNINIIRKNTNWYLKIKEDLYLLNSENFLKLFSNISDKNITITPNKNIYKSYEQMQFNIISKSKGYISILYSESGGKVGIILPNKEINQSITYPPTNSNDSLIAYNSTKDTITELYIAIYAKNRLDLREFEKISDNLLDESNYNFDKLLDIIRNKEFSTIKLKIKSLQKSKG